MNRPMNMVLLLKLTLLSLYRIFPPIWQTMSLSRQPFLWVNISCRFQFSRRHLDPNPISPKLNITFPTNMIEAYVELYASGNGNEEFWVCFFPPLWPLFICMFSNIFSTATWPINSWTIFHLIRRLVMDHFGRYDFWLMEHWPGSPFLMQCSSLVLTYPTHGGKKTFQS